MSISKFIADLSELVLDHYQEKLRGLAFLPGEPILMLLVLDEVDGISFLSRGQIFNYFYKKMRKRDETKKLVLDKGSDPAVVGIVVSPREIKDNFPVSVSILSAGYVVYDPDRILDVKWKVATFAGKKN